MFTDSEEPESLICRDCHSFTKFVSKAFSREIIVRDRVRFHHFKGGLFHVKSIGEKVI